MKKTGHFVNGEVIHEDGKNIEIFNPSNGEIISSINCASKNIIEKTIISSQNAFTNGNSIQSLKELRYFLNIKFC